MRYLLANSQLVVCALVLGVVRCVVEAGDLSVELELRDLEHLLALLDFDD